MEGSRKSNESFYAFDGGNWKSFSTTMTRRPLGWTISPTGNSSPRSPKRAGTSAGTSPPRSGGSAVMGSSSPPPMRRDSSSTSKTNKWGRPGTHRSSPPIPPLDFFEPRHGRGYSKFLARKDGVSVSILAFVQEENALTCRLKVVSDRDADLEVYVAKEMRKMEYLREVQWQCCTKQSNNIFYNQKADALVYDYFIDAKARPDETPFVFLTSTLPSSFYTGARKDFLGPYRDLSNPLAIEKGACPNARLFLGGIFACSYDLSIKKRRGEGLRLHFENDGQKRIPPPAF